MTASFTALGLSKALTDNLERLNISEPTPVQADAIPMVMLGRDLIATAPTGTGKTGAFLLPVLERLIAEPKPGRGPRVLVLSPTRELAAQIGKAAKNFGEGIPRVKTVTITGGESYQQQNRVLSRPYEILIATPGRLLDQLGSDRIDLSRVEVLVLDEADRMLDIGFTDAVLEIAGKIPPQHQTLCFTATLSQDVERLADQLLRDPHRIDVGGETHTRANIAQRVIYVDGLEHKHQLLRHWVKHEDTGQVIVFTATKRDADELAEGLAADGLPAIALHGDLSQRARTRSLNQLRSGEARILIATDVAARGIDVSGISHVINFDLPKFAEDYVHRIGRTGRAGLEGVAVSFVGRQDIGALRRIERFVGSSIEETKVEGLEGRFRPDARGPRGEGRNDRRGGGQRRDQQRRDGGGFRGNRGEGRTDSRGKPRGEPGNRGGADRQPRFGGQDGQRNWRDERPANRAGGERPPRTDRPRPERGPRDDNFGNRAPRDDNFGNRAPRDERQPDSGAEPAPHYYDERQPDFNDNRKPVFDVARRERKRGGQQPRGNGGGQGGNSSGQGGNRPPRRNAGGTGKPAGTKAAKGGKPAARKPRDGNRAGGAQAPRGRRPKQVGLYLPETPVKRADWRNERLADAPKKPRIIKKGEAPRAKREESGGNTWTFTGKTLRLKRKNDGEE